MAVARTKPKNSSHAAPGVIDKQCLYTAEEARRRLRLGEWAWTQMRRDGLVTFRVAGRSFVSGAELITYIETKGKARK